MVYTHTRPYDSLVCHGGLGVICCVRTERASQSLSVCCLGGCLASTFNTDIQGLLQECVDRKTCRALSHRSPDELSV